MEAIDKITNLSDQFMNTLFEKLLKIDVKLASLVLDLVAVRKPFSGRVEESSFRRVPSVRSFTVKPGEENELLIGSGLERKLPSIKKVDIVKEQNKMNQYMARRIKAMRAVLRLGRPDIFWKIVEKEMKRSTAFRTSAINHVLGTWYKSLDFQRVVNITYGVEKILRDEINNLKYFRVFIPKGDPEEIARFFKENPGQPWPGKERPLGVPTAPWRVVLHMWKGFLTLFLEEEIKKYNHAYMPGVGTKSAIQQLVLDTCKHKYIYEFDLKGFFNNVDIDSVIKLLLERGMPASQAAHLERILLSCPENVNVEPETWEYDMEMIRMIEEDGYMPSLSMLYSKDSKSGGASEEMMWDQAYQVESGFGGGEGYSYDDLLGYRKAAILEESQGYQWDGNKYMFGMNLKAGLPQGAAPSTILSLLALSNWYKELQEKGIKLLMYADDGILYADEPFKVFPPVGFEFASEKSGPVRWGDNRPKNEIKFLGVIYNFVTGMLRGSTRNGSTLEFDSRQADVLQLLKAFVPGGSLDEMGAMVKSNIFGLALSKLYGGKFGRLQYDELVQYSDSSYWARYHDLDKLKRDRHTQRIASTVACGWLAGLVKQSMGQYTRDEFFAWSKLYHKYKVWEVDNIEIDDVKAAHEWQNIWNSRDW